MRNNRPRKTLSQIAAVTVVFGVEATRDQEALRRLGEVMAACCLIPRHIHMEKRPQEIVEEYGYLLEMIKECARVITDTDFDCCQRTQP